MKTNLIQLIIVLSLLSLVTSATEAQDLVYISDLNWRSATIGWGSINRDLSVDGHQLKINGVSYEKGIVI